MSDFDVVVIGGGPGGYVCAIRAAQHGLKVACVEGRGTLGGTCLNVGCIPSKALLHASEMYRDTQKTWGRMGIMVEDVSVDLEKLLTHKENTIKGNTQGIEFLFKKNKIEWVQGWGEVIAPGQVKVGDRTLSTKNIVIATGSEPASLPGVEVDEERIVTSTGALSLSSVPEKMVVIGGGVIGLELGSVWQRLGAHVTVIEYLDDIIPGQDAEVQRNFLRLLKRQGMKFVLGAAVQEVEKGEKLNIRYQLRKDESEKTLEADVVLVATGRRPFTDGLGLEAAGVDTERGMVKTDRWRTNVDGIWAIGDVTAGPMLAHKASDEGVAVADEIAGKSGRVNYDVIPSVIYTAPEVASVGLTEEELKEEGRAFKTGKFQFMANARAKANFVADGFVKLLADAETDRILGCHVIGPSAGDMIHEICVAMEFGASAEDLALTCHAHPTYSEAMREAALACGLGAIHA